MDNSDFDRKIKMLQGLRNKKDEIGGDPICNKYNNISEQLELIDQIKSDCGIVLPFKDKTGRNQRNVQQKNGDVKPLDQIMLAQQFGSKYRSNIIPTAPSNTGMNPQYLPEREVDTNLVRHINQGRQPVRDNRPQMGGIVQKKQSNFAPRIYFGDNALVNNIQDHLIEVKHKQTKKAQQGLYNAGQILDDNGLIQEGVRITQKQSDQIYNKPLTQIQDDFNVRPDNQVFIKGNKDNIGMQIYKQGLILDEQQNPNKLQATTAIVNDRNANRIYQVFDEQQEAQIINRAFGRKAQTNNGLQDVMQQSDLPNDLLKPQIKKNVKFHTNIDIIQDNDDIVDKQCVINIKSQRKQQREGLHQDDAEDVQHQQIKGKKSNKNGRNDGQLIDKNDDMNKMLNVPQNKKDKNQVIKPVLNNDDGKDEYVPRVSTKGAQQLKMLQMLQNDQYELQEKQTAQNRKKTQIYNTKNEILPEKDQNDLVQRANMKKTDQPQGNRISIQNDDDDTLVENKKNLAKTKTKQKRGGLAAGLFFQ